MQLYIRRHRGHQPPELPWFLRLCVISQYDKPKEGVGNGISEDVGDGVGDTVGEGVGDSIGDTVGEGVGDSIGDTVGKGVGDDIGEGVRQWCR